MIVLRIYVALVLFQQYRNLEAGDNQSLKFKWRGGELNPGPLAPQAKSLTIRPSLLLNLIEWRVNKWHKPCSDIPGISQNKRIYYM